MNSNDLLTSIITIVVPIVTFIWKTGDFFITRQKIKSAEAIRQTEKNAEIEIEKAKINAGLKAQEEIVKSINMATARVNQMNSKFNSLIDHLVTDDAELRAKLRADA